MNSGFLRVGEGGRGGKTEERLQSCASSYEAEGRVDERRGTAVVLVFWVVFSHHLFDAEPVFVLLDTVYPPKVAVKKWIPRWGLRGKQGGGVTFL